MPPTQVGDMMPASSRAGRGDPMAGRSPIEVINERIRSAQSVLNGAQSRLKGDAHNQSALCELERAKTDVQEWTAKLRQAERGIFE